MLEKKPKLVKDVNYRYFLKSKDSYITLKFI